MKAQEKVEFNFDGMTREEVREVAMEITDVFLWGRLTPTQVRRQLRAYQDEAYRVNYIAEAQSVNELIRAFS